MYKTRLILTTAVMSLALTGMADLAYAQSAKAHKATKGQLASPAQLQREHNRAVKAGDTANDPFNSASSDALNRAQLQGLPVATGLKTPEGNATDASTTGTGDAMTATGEALPPADSAAPGDATTTGEAVQPTEQPMDPKAQSAPPVLPDPNSPATADDTGKSGTNSNPTDAPDKPQAQ